MVCASILAEGVQKIYKVTGQFIKLRPGQHRTTRLAQQQKHSAQERRVMNHLAKPIHIFDYMFHPL